MAFDSVVSIGGQSLLDGLWRILQPALRQLSNPLPITLPGMTDSWVRIRKITPSLSAARPLELTLAVEVELLGNLLLTASVKAGTVNLALPQGTLTFPTTGDTTGALTLPTTSMPVTLPSMSGELPAPLTGTLTLNPSATTSNPSATGSTSLPSTPGSIDLASVTGKVDFLTGGLGNVGLPLPSVVPLALKLTPTDLAAVPATLPLSVAAVGQTSAFSLVIDLGAPVIGAVTSLAAASVFATAITDALRRLLPQLGIPLPGPGFPAGVAPTAAEINATAAALESAARTAIQDVVKDALTGLTARTGRLVFPPPGIGATCETSLLPTAARVQFTPNRPLLQIGFLRTGISSPPFDFPPFFPSGAADVEVRLGTRFTRDLLACLIEKLPNFTFLSAPTLSNSVTRNCCNWSSVALDFGMFSIRGSLSICVVGGPNTVKTIELSGNLTQANGFFEVIGISFTVTLRIRLDSASSITGLTFVSASVAPDVRLQPSVWVMLALASVLVLSAPGLAILIIGLPIIMIEFIKTQLRGIIDTIVSRSHALTSPVAVPPGVFEAFGNFVPASLIVDDPIATGVLATPTSPWELLPISPLRVNRSDSAE